MAETYALCVQIESHEYYGEYYLVGEDMEPQRCWTTSLPIISCESRTRRVSKNTYLMC